MSLEEEAMRLTEILTIGGNMVGEVKNFKSFGSFVPGTGTETNRTSFGTLKL